MFRIQFEAIATRIKTRTRRALLFGTGGQRADGWEVNDFGSGDEDENDDDGDDGDDG